MPSDTPSGERRAARAARLAARAPGADEAGLCMGLLPLRRCLSVSTPSADALVARLPPCGSRDSSDSACKSDSL